MNTDGTQTIHRQKITVEMVSILQSGGLIGAMVACKTGYMNAYRVPGRAAILEKPGYLSICTEEENPDREFIVEIARQIFGEEFAEDRIEIKFRGTITNVILHDRKEQHETEANDEDGRHGRVR